MGKVLFLPSSCLARTFFFTSREKPQAFHLLLHQPQNLSASLFLQTKCWNLRTPVWPRGSTTSSVKCSSSRRKSCRSSRRYQKFCDASTTSIAIHLAYHHQRPPPALMKQQSKIIEVSKRLCHSIATMTTLRAREAPMSFDLH
jgi:hypothetical protein